MQRAAARIVRHNKNRLKLKSDNAGLLNFVRRRFTVKNPNYRYTPFGQKELSCISPTFTFLPGLALDVMKVIKEFDPRVCVDLSDVKSIVLPFSFTPDEIISPENKKFKYWEHQLDSIRLGLKFGRGTFELATASGKSLIIYGLIRNVWRLEGQSRVLIVVPTIQLVAQMAKDFSEYGYEGSLCRFSGGMDRTIGDQPIIISNRQFLQKHVDELPYDIGMVVVDEAHQLAAQNAISKIVSRIPTHVKFGFTGTIPKAKMGEWNIVGICGKILKVKKAKELQDIGKVADTRIVGVRFEHQEKPQIPQDLLDALDVAIENKNDDKIGLAKLEIAKARFPTEWRFIEACEWVNRFMCKMMNALPGNTILLYDHVVHGRKMKAYFDTLETGKNVFLIDGSVPLDHREDVREAMEAGDDCFLFANTKCFGTGINIKNIQNIGFAFPSGVAAPKIIQSIGRGLRKIKGKKNSVNIVDFYHNVRYSRSHFGDRLELYKENYNIDKITQKSVNVPRKKEELEKL